LNLDCDVAVVGAGPAGSRTARNLARAGLRVRLLEEHRRVGVPSHCSGLISPRTLKEAEIGEDAIIHRITGAFVHTSNGGEVALGGGQTRAVAIDRVRWDETLAQQAQNSGAEFVRARLTNASRENSHVRLHTQTDGRDSSFTARVVVGALRTPGLQDLAARHGDIDYPSRVLLRVARSLPALGMLAWVTLRRPAAAWNLARAHLPFAL
jgi:digeranylgeranylglycerophospholipid reductase